VPCSPLERSTAAMAPTGSRRCATLAVSFDRAHAVSCDTACEFRTGSLPPAPRCQPAADPVVLGDVPFFEGTLLEGTSTGEIFAEPFFLGVGCFWDIAISPNPLLGHMSSSETLPERPWLGDFRFEEQPPSSQFTELPPPDGALQDAPCAPRLKRLKPVGAPAFEGCMSEFALPPPALTLDSAAPWSCSPGPEVVPSTSREQVALSGWMLHMAVVCQFGPSERRALGSSAADVDQASSVGGVGIVDILLGLGNRSSRDFVAFGKDDRPCLASTVMLEEDVAPIHLELPLGVGSAWLSDCSKCPPTPRRSVCELVAGFDVLD